MKKRSLSQKLFRTYVGWFILYIGVLLIISLGGVTFIVKKDFRNTQQQLIMSINENVQNYFEEMDAFSMELSNSETFKTVAIHDLPEAYESGKAKVNLFSELYQEAYKMIQKNYNIGVVVADRYYIWMGRDYLISRIDSPSSVYDDLVRDETPMVKYLPKNEYLEAVAPETAAGRSYITLSRSMSLKRPFLNGKEILEVQVEGEEFVNSMSEMLGDKSARDIRINIFDSSGNLLYGESDLELSEYVEKGSGQTFEKDGNRIQVEHIFNNGLTVVYAMDRNVYLTHLVWVWGVMLLLIMGIIGGVAYMTYRISAQTSKSIYEVCEHVRRMDLKKGIGYEPVEIDIEEIDFLSNSLKVISENLEESLEQIITMKDYELHAKMLALQAQMHPHFLFNTLMTIATMAEQEGNDGIYRICMNLNSMFRYISADAPEGVSIFDEIRQVDCYVSIMKERFPESIVDIDIPLEMMGYKIPKLVIQPLVENAFKYCNRQKPEIAVKGNTDPDGSWSIIVSDNGRGFSHESKQEIMEKCKEGMENEKMLSSQIDGMGLVNVYVRMKLFYGDEMVYFIEENKGRIEIGRRKKSDGEWEQDSNSCGRR